MKFLAALRFLTIIPLPSKRPFTAQEMGHSLAFFPVAGLIIGLSLAGLNWLMGLILPPAVARVLLIVWMVIISGGLHLDGLADTCDGLGGQKSAEARLAVMKDSRVGGFGVIGVALLILVKYVTLASIPASIFWLVLIFFPAISRWTMVYAIYAFPYARPSGLGTVFKKESRRSDFVIATLITLAATLGLTAIPDNPISFLAGVVIIVFTWVIIYLLASYLKSRLNGLTGDTYGAINEIAEVSVLVLASIMAFNHWLLV